MSLPMPNLNTLEPGPLFEGYAEFHASMTDITTLAVFPAFFLGAAAILFQVIGLTRADLSEDAKTAAWAELWAGYHDARLGRPSCYAVEQVWLKENKRWRRMAGFMATPTDIEQMRTAFLAGGAHTVRTIEAMFVGGERPVRLDRLMAEAEQVLCRLKPPGKPPSRQRARRRRS